MCSELEKIQNIQEAKKRINALRSEIEHHRYLYHVLDKQEISDEALDLLKHELHLLEEKFPQLKSKDSPTQRVGGKALNSFKKVRHRVRQWSLEDAFSEEEILNWDKRIKKIIKEKTGEDLTQISYCCEPKIDGLHLVLEYQASVLKHAATRGDGVIGEDVTENAKTIEAIPLRLRGKKKLNLVIEGEALIRKSVFERINQERQAAGQEILANPRNAAAGAIRQLDPKVARERKLDFFAYDISWPDKVIPKAQIEELSFLRELGFKVNNNIRLAQNITNVIYLWKEWQKKKEQKDYWTDGIVAKVNQRSLQKALGFTGKSPRWALALKYPGEEVISVVKRIFLSIGRTGKLTPVAELRPVKIAGTKVSRASLHNLDEIKRLDVREGDSVIVHKAGDIIPQIKIVLKQLRPKGAQKFTMPAKCPACGSKIIKPKDEVNHYCSNKKCGISKKQQICHFVSKKGFNIEGMGPKVVEQLISEGLINQITDIFLLKEGDLEPMARFAEKSSSKLVQAIEKSKKINLVKFISALGIKYVGEEIALLLEKYLHYKNIGLSSKELLGFFEKISPKELMQIDGIGPKIVDSLVSYLKDKNNFDTIKKLFSLGIKIIPDKVTEAQREKSTIAGLSFVFTGTLLSMSREEAQKKVRALGGKIRSAVSQRIDFLVAGKNPGSKYHKAKNLGIKIISEQELLKMLR